MSGMTIWRTGLVFAGLLAPSAPAQENPAGYRLSFRLDEAGPETKTSKTFSMVVQSRARAKINASRRIPYYTSSKKKSVDLHTAAIGTIIDCGAFENGAGVRLDCSFESSFVEPGQSGRTIPTGFLPVMNSRQFFTNATVATGSDVQLASFEDPVNESRIDIYVKVEKMAAIP